MQPQLEQRFQLRRQPLSKGAVFHIEHMTECGDERLPLLNHLSDLLSYA